MQINGRLRTPRGHGLWHLQEGRGKQWQFWSKHKARGRTTRARVDPGNNAVQARSEGAHHEGQSRHGTQCKHKAPRGPKSTRQTLQYNAVQAQSEGAHHEGQSRGTRWQAARGWHQTARSSARWCLQAASEQRGQGRLVRLRGRLHGIPVPPAGCRWLLPSPAHTGMAQIEPEMSCL